MKLSSVRLLDMEMPGASISGMVKGSPIDRRQHLLRLRAPALRQPITNGRVLASSAAISRSRPGKAYLLLGRGRNARGTVAPRLPQLPGTGARASLPPFPALQLVVRHRLFQQVR